MGAPKSNKLVILPLDSHVSETDRSLNREYIGGPDEWTASLSAGASRQRQIAAGQVQDEQACSRCSGFVGVPRWVPVRGFALLSSRYDKGRVFGEGQD